MLELGSPQKSPAMLRWQDLVAVFPSLEDVQWPIEVNCEEIKGAGPGSFGVFYIQLLEITYMGMGQYL